ncbi:PhnA protein [Ensifer sp. YR511]|nr:PhnA protein [Ensifer sp. YR511]
MDVKDSIGAILKDGDNVTLIKDLKGKGTSTTLKRGTMVKRILPRSSASSPDQAHPPPMKSSAASKRPRVG